MVKSTLKKVGIFFCSSLLIAFELTGCGDGGSEKRVIKKSDSSTEASTSNAGTDVPAELGGAGFTGEGWLTNSEAKSSGSKNAKKGGDLTMVMDEYPPTYRGMGKDTRHIILTMMEGMMYESLLGMDSETLEWEPAIATHWKISDDKKTYWFRINPEAKWADGKPITAQDVVATYNLLVDEGIEDPSSRGLYFENYETPVAESKYIVRVNCKKENWRSFIYFSGIPIYPAYYLSKIDGAGYLTKYQYQMMPVNGPYELDTKNTIKGETLVLRRRPDYWAVNQRRNLGLNNFDQIRFVFVIDDRLKLEKFKAGEFDLYIPSRAQWWHQELTAESVDEIKRGLIQKQKIFNYKPLGTSGLAFNTLEEPFNDIRVRQAFEYLWNVDQLMEKLFFNEYERCRSYYGGSVYENKDNPTPEYNPNKAVKLLTGAGWTKKPGEKWLSKEGKNFEIDFMSDQSLERIFTPFQQDLEKVGIKLNLVNMTPQAKFEKVMKKKFKVSYQGWTGLFFPNPESSMHSKYAKELETNNITGMANKRIDEICDLYDQSYDVQERIKLLQELDGIATAEKHYAWGWVAPYGVRCVYWNKFDLPETGLTYSGDWRVIPSLWWYNADKAKALEEAKQDKSKTLPIRETILDYWGKRKDRMANK